MKEIIQTAASVVALGLSMWAIILTIKHGRQLKKQACFDRKYLIIEVLQNFLTKDAEYLYTKEYQTSLSDARNIVRTHFEKELEQRILHVFSTIYFNMKERNPLDEVKITVFELVEDLIQDIKLVK